ncbi:hypothetical protein [Jiulongibacter sediminis]|uniref:hypothetical protein n=1 Tax=Jiulongibacter sediminis TaxID=1605367 RepID=UPI0026E93188|nr:hypothetical protein [Jiulongibacter sediminis]
MIDNSDVVICGSEEQKKLLDELHNNVKIVRDYFYDDINIVKSRYELNKPGELNVLWEGLSHGGKEIFKLLKEILNSVDSLKINVHIVCDSEYCQLGSSYFCRSTYKVLKHIFKNSSVSFHHYDWCSSTFSSIATACDIAVIPIPDNEFMKKKPENKLIFLWLMGIPVISSDIDSYKRVMSEASLDYYCSDLSDWKNKLESLASSRSERLKYMNNVNTYLKANYSKESIFQMNEAIFFSNL